MSAPQLSRRGLLRLGTVAGSSLALAGCDAFDGLRSPDSRLREVLESASRLTYRVQRLLIGNDTLAPEFAATAIRQGQKPNGSTDPQTQDYLALKAKNFADYRLRVTGLVEKELSLSLAQLRNMPARTQITRHDCVEGWSTIAKWSGTPLAHVLDAAGVKPQARFVVFRCFDSMGSGLSGPELYYESCDMLDARHAQTILAYALADEQLPVPFGAPLRVRIERQLGYKMAKYVHTIEVVDSFAKFGGGKGGYWEDRGYEWYAGI